LGPLRAALSSKNSNPKRRSRRLVRRNQGSFRAIKVASTVLIKQFPEFFQWIEWSLDDLTGNGFPICDDYIDCHWGDSGIPADFKFKFDSTQQDFEDFYEIKGAYA
jgi:streptogramin lyase